MTDDEMLQQLRIERDATVSAGLPTRYNQQTIVGNISGAGNRHVIDDPGRTGGGGSVPSQLPDVVTLEVTDGTTTVTNVTTIAFDGDLFTVSDGGGGTANVTLKTTECP
jgi:hypothetical protein